MPIYIYSKRYLFLNAVRLYTVDLFPISKRHLFLNAMHQSIIFNICNIHLALNTKQHQKFSYCYLCIFHYCFTFAFLCSIKLCHKLF